MNFCVLHLGDYQMIFNPSSSFSIEVLDDDSHGHANQLGCPTLLPFPSSGLLLEAEESNQKRVTAYNPSGWGSTSSLHANLSNRYDPFSTLPLRALMRSKSITLMRTMSQIRSIDWKKIPVSLTELCIDTTLRCGQSFR